MTFQEYSNIMKLYSKLLEFAYLERMNYVSYDIRLCDPITKETIELANRHYLTGGTYAIGGTHEASLSSNSY